MNVVFNNQLLYVAEYPGQDAVEIIDKRNGVGGLIRDAAAQRFRDEFSELMAGTPDAEDFGEFIDHYQALLNQPAIYH